MKRGFKKFSFSLKKEVNCWATHKLLLTVALMAFILTFLLPTISATFTPGTPNYSIEKIYGPSSDVSGWLNISFTGEPLDSPFVSTVGSETKSVNLLELLAMNTGYAYSCSPVGCGNNYVAVGEGNSLIQKDLGANENITYGLKIVGENFNSIESFSFNFSSDAIASELPQLIIDILGDGESEWVPTMPSGAFTENKNYGCYNPPATSSGVINLYPYSNLIKLSPSPNLKIGATITALSGGNANFSMEIKEVSSGRIGSCNINNINAGGEINCMPKTSGKNFSITKEGNFLVSIWSGDGSENKYGINYKTNQTCRGSNAENFQIFVQPGTYAPLSDIRLNSTEIEKSTGVSGIENKITNYIVSRYNRDCGGDGCAIPIKFYSKNPQNLSISNIQVFYKRGAITEFSSQVYDISTAPARISSGFKRLYIDGAGFFVPDNLGNYTFSLKLNGETVISEKIQVKDVPIIQSVNPTKTASAFPTDFVVSVDSDYNLTSFSWDFGDGTVNVITTGNSGNKTTHTYNQTGAYNLKITATDSRGLSGSKTFLINVSSPANLIVLRLAELRASLRDINGDIASLDSFSKKAINASLGLSAVEASISSLQSRYSSATTEVQFNAIVTDLIKIRELPESISKTAYADGLLFVSEADYVDLNVLKEIAGGNFSSEDEEGYINGALFWQLENLDTKVDFAEFSGRYGSTLEPIVKTFKMSVDEKTDISYDYFLIMPMLAGFSSDSAFRNKSGYIYVNMKDIGTFSFSTTEDVDFTSLPAFISPAISRLTIEETLPEEEKTSKWLIFGLVILALLIIGIIVYMVLQEWYRRKYENHLFPNRNDLYNMAHYINNAKKKDMSNSDIESNLKKAGWSAERIRYAMRKYAGKRTGMFEIPITKIVKEIEKGEDK